MKDSGRSRHVLIADDDAAIAYVFQRYFELHGFHVSVAHDGNAALALGQSHAIDALVTDFRMPGIDGRELVMRLRQRMPGLPAIIVSGYTHDIGGSLADVRIVSKPVDPAFLVASVEEMLVDAETARRLGGAGD